SYQLSGENPRNHHRSVRQPNKVRLVTARVEPLLDPFCVAFREPTFFAEAIHRFPQQVHVSSPTSIHLEDSSGVERHLVAHFTACSGAGTICKVTGIGNINIRCTRATEAVP